MSQSTCACGRKMAEYYWNSIIKRKQCPNCELKNQLDGSKEIIKRNTKTKKKSKPRKKKTDREKLEEKMDTAWSLLVKLKAGKKCEYCGKEKYLNSHHIFSRGKHSVRWSTINGISLCVGHHIGLDFSAHKTPTKFTMWLIKHKRQGFMDKLEMQANITSHFHEFEKKVILEELEKEIEILNQ